MDTPEQSTASCGLQPYRRLRDDPRYAEIKRIIDQFPAEKMEELKLYIERWTSETGC